MIAYFILFLETGITCYAIDQETITIWFVETNHSIQGKGLGTRLGRKALTVFGCAGTQVCMAMYWCENVEIWKCRLGIFVKVAWTSSGYCGSITHFANSGSYAGGCPENGPSKVRFPQRPSANNLSALCGFFTVKGAERSLVACFLNAIFGRPDF